MRRPRFPPRLPIPAPRLFLLVSTAILVSLPGILSSRLVTLGAIEIYTTHEWLPTKPTVYFRCQGENKTFLPDVKKIHILYSFKGEESWQPLTELPEKKCKRCGLYEQDILKSDDVYDEWELCSDDFVKGGYIRFKDKEFNATFVCLNCTSSADSSQTSSPTTGAAAPKKSPPVLLVVIICLLAFSVSGIGIVSACKYWQNRKREQDQARFLKLFEEVDDIEDELGLAHEI